MEDRKPNEENIVYSRLFSVVSKSIETLRYYKDGDTWKAAEERRWKVARAVAKALGRGKAFRHGYAKAWDVSWDLAWKASMPFLHSTSVRDQIKVIEAKLKAKFLTALLLKLGNLLKIILGILPTTGMAMSFLDLLLAIRREIRIFSISKRARHVILPIVVYTARYASWETIKDIPGFEKNPYELVLAIIEMGLRPVGFEQMDDHEEFVIDFPTILGEKDVLGCWHSGESQILYYHEWGEDCKNRRPLGSTHKV